jgi:hypothetical protein
MTILYINTGTSPNAGNGDTLRTAFNKINNNFKQFSTGSTGAVLIQGSTPPVGYGTGTFWYDTISGRTFIYYQSTWVDASPNISNTNTNGTGGGGTSTITVGLINSVDLVQSNTVTNVSNIRFDTESAFSVTDLGTGTVMIGMNSTFKYITIDAQSTLTAVGLDTLKFIAGRGIRLLTDPTPGNQSITIINTLTATSILPTTSTSGFLYDDGANNFSWQKPTVDSLTTGTTKFKLNNDGSVTFNDTSIQTTAYVRPSLYNPLQNLINRPLVSWDTGTSGLVYDPLIYVTTASGTIHFNRIIFSDTSQQTTAWPGSLSLLQNGTSTAFLSTTGAFILSGTLVFPDATIQRTAWTGTISYSQISNPPTIPPLTTSTLYNSAYSAKLNSDGTFVIPSELDVQYQGTTEVSVIAQSGGGLINSPVSNNPLKIQTTSSSKSYIWQFNPDGTITWPDGSVQASANTATSLAATATNYINNGIKKLSVLADGGVQFPNGGVQYIPFQGTATTATMATYLFNDPYRLRPVGVPPVLTGSPGDLAGDVAADATFLYYCYAGYATVQYTVHVVDSLTGVNYIDVEQGNYPQPQPGWTFQDPLGGPVQVVTSVGSGAIQSGPYAGKSYWRLNEGTVANTYIAGLNYILTNNSIPTPGWGKIPWSAAGTNNSTVVTRTSSLVSLGSNVYMDNLVARWINDGSNNALLQITSLTTSSFRATYNLITNYNGAVSSVNGVSVNIDTNGITLGGSAYDAGDLATVVLSVPSTSNAYRITALTGASFANNLIAIEKLL